MCMYIYITMCNSELFLYEFRSIPMRLLQPKNYDRHIQSSDTFCIDRTKKKISNVKSSI